MTAPYTGSIPKTPEEIADLTLQFSELNKQELIKKLVSTVSEIGILRYHLCERDGRIAHLESCLSSISTPNTPIIFGTKEPSCNSPNPRGFIGIEEEELNTEQSVHYENSISSINPEETEHINSICNDEIQVILNPPEDHSSDPEDDSNEEPLDSINNIVNAKVIGALWGQHMAPHISKINKIFFNNEEDDSNLKQGILIIYSYNNEKILYYSLINDHSIDVDKGDSHRVILHKQVDTTINYHDVEHHITNIVSSVQQVKGRDVIHRRYDNMFQSSIDRIDNDDNSFGKSIVLSINFDHMWIKTLIDGEFYKVYCDFISSKISEDNWENYAEKVKQYNNQEIDEPVYVEGFLSINREFKMLNAYNLRFI